MWEISGSHQRSLEEICKCVKRIRSCLFLIRKLELRLAKVCVRWDIYFFFFLISFIGVISLLYNTIHFVNHNANDTKFYYIMRRGKMLYIIFLITSSLSRRSLIWIKEGSFLTIILNRHQRFLHKKILHNCFLLSYLNNRKKKL